MPPTDPTEQINLAKTTSDDIQKTLQTNGRDAAMKMLEDVLTMNGKTFTDAQNDEGFQRYWYQLAHELRAAGVLPQLSATWAKSTVNGSNTNLDKIDLSGDKTLSFGEVDAFEGRRDLTAMQRLMAMGLRENFQQIKDAKNDKNVNTITFDALDAFTKASDATRQRRADDQWITERENICRNLVRKLLDDKSGASLLAYLANKTKTAGVAEISKSALEIFINEYDNENFRSNVHTGINRRLVQDLLDAVNGKPSPFSDIITQLQGGKHARKGDKIQWSYGNGTLSVENLARASGYTGTKPIKTEADLRSVLINPDVKRAPEGRYGQ